MAHAIRYINKDSSYLSQKHYCPDCQSVLKKIKVSKVMNSNSQEAADMPKMFSKTRVGIGRVKFRRYNYVGDVEYIWNELECEICNRHFTVEEMKKIEGVAMANLHERSPEEIKKIKQKKLLFNTILPIIILILIAIVHKIVG